MRGRCPCYGNRSNGDRGGVKFLFPGIGGTVVADASGVACVASGATIAITLDGVVTIVDGAVYYI